LLPSESRGPTAYSKCCAKGRVNLPKIFSDLQQRPQQLLHLLHGRAPNYEKFKKDLLTKAVAYNDNLSFGYVKIESKKDFPEHYRIVKCNNMIQYMLFDFNPPAGREQPLLRGQLFTIPPEFARESIEKISKKTDYLNVR